MSTGGTGGHIYPAVATAHEWQKRGFNAMMMGQSGGMEERVAAEQGLEFFGVSAGKLARSGQGRADPRELVRAARGLKQARSHLAKLRPSVVVGYGGFASLPGVLAAQSLGIPTILHEQNARLGLTQRLAVRLAKEVGTAYEKVIGLKDEKASLVGMPVREARVSRETAITALSENHSGFKEGPLTIFIMGGSQGSLYMNDHIPGVLRELFGPEGRLPSGQQVQVLHATGKRWIEKMEPVAADLPWYHMVGYVNAVAAWAVADLAITRGGTGTLAEAAFHGVPLLMVPLPESAENHQYHNAKNVEESGGGRVIEQVDLIHDLAHTVLECSQENVIKQMRAAALGRAQPGAAGRLANLIERHVHVQPQHMKYLV